MDGLMVSVCIPTWNGAERLEKCLDSLIGKTHDVRYEVIVVDNGSTDGTSDKLRARFPWVNLIQNRTNAGFAHAINQAARIAKGKYLAFVNNDIVLVSDALSVLFRYLETAPHDVAVVGPRIELPGGAVQYSMSHFPTAFRFLLDAALVFKAYSVLRGRNIPCLAVADDKKYDVEDCSVDWLIGAFLMVRRDTFLEMGMFDERFFFGNEDIDFCWRVHQLGGHVCYCPEARVVHEHSGSFKGGAGGEGLSSLQARIVRRQVQGWRGLEELVAKHRGPVHAFGFRMTKRFWALSRILLWGGKGLVGLLTGKRDGLVLAYLVSSWRLMTER